MRRYLLLLAVAGLLLGGALLAGCTTTTTTNPTTAPTTGAAGQTTATGGGGAAVVDLVAQDVKFDKSTVTVPRGSSVTVNFQNKDSGVPHNVAFYTDSSASTPIYKGQIVNGPGTVTYTFIAPAQPGTYFFRCDVHPTTMTGQFIVT